MNTLRVLFLILVFALGILFLVQNIQVLDTRASLVLDLWLVELSTPYMEIYIFLFLALLLGIIFGALTFLPGNRELRESLGLLKMKINRLTREITAMQKDEDVHGQEQEEKREPEAASGTEDQPEYSSLDKDVVIKTGGTSGKAALVGVFGIFVLLTALYFYVDQKISAFQSSMDRVMEDSMNAAELAARADQEAMSLKEDVSGLSGMLHAHEKEISRLSRLPQDTMDYLTLMRIDEYASSIEQLMQKAESETDRKMLTGVLESLNKAMEHYKEKPGH